MSDVALPLYAETISGNLVTSEGSAFALPNGKRGDTTTLGIIFRDGIDTTVAGISDVKMTLREKDAEDANTCSS
jgi:hypothetical protein